MQTLEFTTLQILFSYLSRQPFRQWALTSQRMYHCSQGVVCREPRTITPFQNDATGRPVRLEWPVGFFDHHETWEMGSEVMDEIYASVCPFKTGGVREMQMLSFLSQCRHLSRLILYLPNDWSAVTPDIDLSGFAALRSVTIQGSKAPAKMIFPPQLWALMLQFNDIGRVPLSAYPLPSSLKSLHFTRCEVRPNDLPRGLTNLSLQNAAIHGDAFPSALRRLKLWYCQVYGNVPINVPRVSISWLGVTQPPLIGDFVQELELQCDVGEWKDVQFSKYLRFLTLRAPFNYMRKGWLPDSLEYLDLGDRFNRPFLPNMLPKRLKTLVLGGYYTHFIPEGILPSTLQSLTVGHRYDRPFQAEALPSSLRLLRLYSQSCIMWHSLRLLSRPNIRLCHGDKELYVTPDYSPPQLHPAKGVNEYEDGE